MSDEKIDEETWLPVRTTKVAITSPSASKNWQIYNINKILESSLAILLSKKAQEELSNQEWRRLNDIVDMHLKLSKLDLNNKQTSILEGKTDAEIIEIVELAKATLGVIEDDEE